LENLTVVLHLMKHMTSESYIIILVVSVKYYVILYCNFTGFGEVISDIINER